MTSPWIVSVTVPTTSPCLMGAASSSGTLNTGSVSAAPPAAGSDVSRNQVLYTLSRVSLFFSGTYFKVVIALTLFVVGCYGIYIAGRVLLASRKTH